MVPGPYTPVLPGPWMKTALGRHIPLDAATIFHCGSFPERLTAEGSQPATLSAAGGINPSGLGHSTARITLTVFINL